MPCGCLQDCRITPDVRRRIFQDFGVPATYFHLGFRASDECNSLKPIRPIQPVTVSIDVAPHKPNDRAPDSDASHIVIYLAVLISYLQRSCHLRPKPHDAHKPTAKGNILNLNPSLSTTKPSSKATKNESFSQRHLCVSCAHCLHERRGVLLHEGCAKIKCRMTWRLVYGWKLAVCRVRTYIHAQLDDQRYDLLHLHERRV